jgi:hypothetical protein
MALAFGKRAGERRFSNGCVRNVPAKVQPAENWLKSRPSLGRFREFSLGCFREYLRSDSEHQVESVVWSD